MGIEEDKLLADFHHTISEQLNARLSESPKFFALLVVVSTGYGYVLSDEKFSLLFISTSILSYVAILWASWYLAALGYAFRFLQNSQHLIEVKLGWNPQYVPHPMAGRSTGQPPPVSKSPLNAFWLLPGIYHPHAAGLIAFLAMVCGTFCYREWCFRSHKYVLIVGVLAFVGALTMIVFMNAHYLGKFRTKWKNPL